MYRKKKKIKQLKNNPEEETTREACRMTFSRSGYNIKIPTNLEKITKIHLGVGKNKTERGFAGGGERIKYILSCMKNKYANR